MPKMTSAEVEEKVAAAKKLVPVGSKWVHYKKPDAEHAYEVISVSLFVTGDNEVVMITYRPLYEDVAQVDFTRTLEEWLETVETSGGTVPRFKQLSE